MKKIFLIAWPLVPLMLMTWVKFFTERDVQLYYLMLLFLAAYYINLVIRRNKEKD
tara:strand:- start:46516 stop:46680 length:165 start_codon:yes stop_codon:yes gene_type:complete